MGVNTLGSINIDPDLTEEDLELSWALGTAPTGSRPKTFANHQKELTMKERELVLEKKRLAAEQPPTPTPPSVTLESAARHAKVTRGALKLALLVAPQTKHQSLLESLSKVDCNWDPPPRY